MNNKNSFLFSVSLILGVVGFVNTNSNAAPSLPPKPSCVKKVSKTINVNGNFDGKGCLYSWRGKGYPKYCNASKEISEGLPPMFKLNPGAKIKDLQMECALDGIHTSRNNTIDNIVNRDVEEDAVTLVENVTVRNSMFFSCQDKALQMNRAKNIKIYNNTFVNCKSPILANSGSNVTVTNNKFYNVTDDIRSRTTRSDITVKGNLASGVKNCFLQAQDGGRIFDDGGHKLTNVKRRECEVNGGIIK